MKRIIAYVTSVIMSVYIMLDNIKLGLIMFVGILAIYVFNNFRIEKIEGDNKNG